jgi:hypothetical protein
LISRTDRREITVTASANTLRDLMLRTVAFIGLTMASTAVLALPYLG